MAKRSRYVSYLLRLWQTRDGETWVWRASLESPGTGDRHGFASLKALFEFLETQTDVSLIQDEHGPAYGSYRIEGGEETDKK
jgi:hypothetical protein